MLEFTTLGTIGLRSAEKGTLATVLAQPRRLALLLYLAIEAHDGFVPRETLLALFWAESDDTRARAALRQALRFLRQALGETALRVRSDDAIGIDTTVVRCDAVNFRQAIKAGRFTEGLDLYTGEFANGLTIDEAVGFDQWLSLQREQFVREAAAASLHVANDALVHGDHHRALVFARRAQELQPFDEGSHRLLLRALDASGDRASMAEAHEAFVERLKHELNVEPSPETTHFFARLRDRETVHVVPHSFSKSLHARDGESASGVQPLAAATTTLPDSAGPPANARTHWPWAAAILFPLVVLAMVMWWPSGKTLGAARNEAEAPGIQPVVVVPFRNETGDSTLTAIGRMTSDWITAGLSRLDGVAVVPLTAAMVIEHAGDSVMRVASSELHARAIVSGAVYQTGNTLHFQVRVTDGKTQALLRPVETESVHADSVMAGIDRLRSRVVAVFASLTDSVTHLSRASVPPSYASYRAYVTGLETFVSGNPMQALVHFRRAADSDSTFAMPRIAASIMLLNIDSIDAGARVAFAIDPLRPTLGPLELATLDMVQALLRGDLASADAAVGRQARIAPGSIGEYMVAEVARRRNRPAEALRVLRKMGPERGELRGWQAYWRELTYALHMTGAHEQELRAARDAYGRYPGSAEMRAAVVRALAALGDRRALSSSLAESDNGMLRVIAAAEWKEHRHADAKSVVQEQVTWLAAHAAREPDNDAPQVQHAWLLLLDGQSDMAQQLAEARATTAALSTQSAAARVERIGLAGVMAASAGDRARAAQHGERLASETRQMTTPMQQWLAGEVALWQSAIAAQSGDTAASATLLQKALQSGLSVDPWLLAHPAFAHVRRTAVFQQILLAHR